MSITLKIVVPEPAKREWKTLDEVLETFSQQEVCEIVHRYCDSQDHAKRYRVNRASRIKAMETVLKAQGVDTTKLV